VPMHEIRVVPNLQVDPDYTLDDFIYSPPQPADVRHPEKYIAQLAGGERVLCREVVFGPDGVRLQGLPAGLPDRTCAAADVLRVPWPAKAPPPLLWDEAKKDWQKVSDVRLTEGGVRYTPEGGSPQTLAYTELSALYLRQPVEPAPVGWHVRTAQGEEIILDG